MNPSPSQVIFFPAYGNTTKSRFCCTVCTMEIMIPFFFFFWFSRNIQSPLLNVSHKVFAEIGKPDKVALTAMLAGYAMHGQGKEAIEFFQRTVLEGMKPDHVTFALLSACSHSGLVKEGKYYFQIMSDIYVVKPQLDHN